MALDSNYPGFDDDDDDDDDLFLSTLEEDDYGGDAWEDDRTVRSVMRMRMDEGPQLSELDDWD